MPVYVFLIGCERAPAALPMSAECVERPVELSDVELSGVVTDSWAGERSDTGGRVLFATEASPDTGIYTDRFQIWTDLLGCVEMGEGTMCLREIERSVFCPDANSVEVQIDSTIVTGGEEVVVRFDGSADPLLTRLFGDLWVIDHPTHGDRLLEEQVTLNYEY